MPPMGKMHEVESKYGQPIAEVLRECYAKHGHERNVQAAVAAELGVSQPTLSQWLMRLRLRQRTMLEDDAPRPASSAERRAAGE